ncbi:hypothetical protein MKW92_022996 [Papaver armeniacum]|nr:hypothetical protein MKW92_022996 [Papaver armeniacum]
MKLTMATLVWLVSSCLLLLIWGSTSLPKAYAMPPPSPVDCDATGCKLHNSYGVWNDRKREELRLAVAEANRKKLKAKIITGFSHTIPKLACPGNELSKNSVLISTAKYNSGIQVDVKSLTVTADSGVVAGLSLVASPYWEGVSIGGLISTGAHGSSWWGKVVQFMIMWIRKNYQLDSRNQIFNAAKLSLGPGFKRSITNIYSNDRHFEDEFMDLAKKHEFADITWNPSKHAVIYRQDDRVPLNSSGDGINDYIGFQSNLILISKTVRSSEKALETSRNVNGKCLMANTVVGYKKLVANGLKNNNLLFTGYPVVGRQGKMQTSGSCLYSAASNTLSTYVKKLRDLKPEHFCGVDIYNGFLIRFIKASDAYLGQPEDSVVVDFNYYRANEASTPRLNQDIWEEVEQIAFFKYGAKPHWAKNRNLAFLGVQQKYPNFCKFLAAKKQLDPDNMFSSYWSDKIIFGNETEKAEGCAMEGMCICSEDKHCNPSKGYFCKPGVVYNQAKVCRFSASLLA